jgi:biopolymer transport protein ExbD
MATIENNQTQSKFKKVRFKKLSTTVDLTPMVDLGFLLITFFIFATTLATAKAVKFRVPNDEVDPNHRNNMLTQAAFTALISPNTNHLYYYTQDEPDHAINGIKLIKSNELRAAIVKHKQYMQQLQIPDSLISFSIKVLPTATYGSFVNVFDEVAINNIRNYFKVKPDINELIVIDAINKANQIAAIPKTEKNEKPN